MAFLLSCLLLLSSFASGCAQPIINLDSSLSPTTPPWHSPSGRFAFGFYPEGDGFSIGVWLVTSPGNITVIWTALRHEAPFADDTVLKLTTEGLKLHLPNSKDRHISNIPAIASSASMFDSGNFVIHGAGSAPLWQTFDHPTDTIMGGQELSSDHKLVSSVSETNHSEGRFLLEMQNNGRLLMYPVDTTDTWQDAYWNSNDTNSKGYTSLFLDINGHMYLSGGNETKNLTGGYWTSPATIYRATLGADGIFRLYSNNLARRRVFVLAKFPNTRNQCEINGVCGMNSYCNITDGRPVCLCFPGFDYIDTHETSSGCSRNFTYSCWGNGDNETFSMSSLERVGWLDDPYTILPLNSKDECSDACLEDCNCNAVLYYNSGKCHKQKFPLRYGRVGSIETTMAYIKVATKKPAQGSAAIEGVKKVLRM